MTRQQNVWRLKRLHEGVARGRQLGFGWGEDVTADRPLAAGEKSGAGKSGAGTVFMKGLCQGGLVGRAAGAYGCEL